MHHDGKIIFSTELDNDGMEKDLAKMKKDIAKQEETVLKGESKKSPLVQQAEELRAKIKAARAEAEKYKAEWMAGGVGADKSQSEAELQAAQLQTEYDQVVGKIDKIDESLLPAQRKLEEMQQAAGELEEKLSETGPDAKKMAEAMEKAEKNAKRFALRLKEVLRSALIFTLITQSLAKFREWMGKVIRTNDEASAAIARLKGALLTMAQPLVDVVIPVLTMFLNLLTAIVGEIARFVSALFGSTVDQSAEAAENLKKEADALDATGSAAKKAGKSLASFDEINKLSNNQGGAGGSSVESIAPDFSWTDSISDKLAQMAKDVLMIGTGFALWKIASSLPGQLGTILTILGGLLIAMGGILLFYEGFTDAWENGVDWGNLAAMIAGVAAAAFGLYVVFGNIGAAIALVVGGIAMLVTGFKDVIKNGANLKNTLLIIAGIIATGLGIALLTGNLIPLLIAGIVAVITAMIAWQGNLGEFAEAFQQIFNGIIDFFVGMFTGDFERAWNGIRNIVIGIINAIVIAFESFINTIIDGLNWLISKANSLAEKVGIKGFIPEIPKIELPRIPYLAQGAVIPPNREFLAVLGDQKSGTNIETPLSTMIEAFRTAMRDMNIGGGQNEAYLVVDDEVLGKIIYRLYNKESHRVGVNLSEA